MTNKRPAAAGREENAMAEETTEPIIEEAGEPQEQETVTLEDLDLSLIHI